MQELEEVNLPLLCDLFSFVTQERLVHLAMISSVDRKHLFLFLLYFFGEPETNFVQIFVQRYTSR